MTDTSTSQPPPSMSSEQAYQQALQQTLQQAVSHHQAGQLQEAENLYRAVLLAQPQHPEANHKLGNLLVEMQQPAAGLPHLEAALAAKPESEHYWLSYIDTLIKAGQADVARHALALGRKHGLQGEAVEMLAARLADSRQVAEQSGMEQQHTVETIPTASPATPRVERKRSKPAKSAGKPAPRVRGGREPSPQEVNALVGMFNQGRYSEGEVLARALTAHFPRHGFGWKVLGVLLRQQGKLEEAIVSMQTAALLLPGDAETHNNLGAALNEQGQSQAAETSLRRALELDPNSAEARCNLGAALEEQGRLADAEVSYRHSLKIKPNFAEAHSNLGNTLMKQGRLFEAETSYRRALELKPDYAEPLSALGNTFLKQGRLTEAAACLGRALEIKPDFAVAYNNLGNSQHAQGRITEAEASYRQALEINPDYAEAHNNLGVTLSEQGRLTEAEVCYRRALEIKLDYAEAHNNLGVSVMEQGRLTEAEACYRRALEIDPNYAVAYNCLGNILHNQDRLTEALAQYHQVMAIQPDDLQYAIHAHLLLPIIPQTLDMIQVWRARYQSGIAALMDATGSLDDPGNEVNPPSFYLAYQNYDDRSVMETLCRLFRSRVPNLTVTASHVDAWRPPVISGRRIRVGFLSQFLVSHTIGKLYQGFIRHLDRSRFEVVVIHAPRSKLDTYSQSLEAPANRVIALPAKLKDQQKAVAEAKLDVLFYPDIGMAASTYFLAYARLAPVQVVSWGHPDTTGLDTMDYFLSSSFIEPKDAEAHYTEKLICLNRIPCYYQPLLAPNRIPARVTQGLPETGTLYGCPQSLFKFHPDFDAVLAAIAEGDPAGHIVLLEGANPVWVELLRARWAKTFPILLDRVLFLPRMPLERFMAFMAHVDILLDPVHFGSGNTLYEAMVYGTPLVTWAGQFMRGRIVAGAYQQMGIADAPIAPNLKDYAPLALALGRDHERRQNLRQASLKAAGRELFADMRAVREFEDFLEAAVAAAGHGEKLPAGWHPDIHVTQTQQGASA